MIIFLYGPDSYRSAKRKNWYLAQYIKKHSALGIGRFDFYESEAYSKLEEFIRGRSLFDTFKLVLIDNAFKEDKPKLAELLKSFVNATKDITIILESDKAPLKAFKFLLAPPVIAEEFPLLAGYDWELFLRKEAKERGLTLSHTAAHFLREAYLGDSWRLTTELDKLVLWQKSEIGVEELEKLGIEIAPNFWSLLNNLRSPDKVRRLNALEIIFASNEPAAKVFNILSAQWPEKAKEFALFDLAVKSGSLDYEEAMLSIALS